MVVLDLGSPKKLGGVAGPFPKAPCILRGDDANHPRRTLGSAQIHGSNPALGKGRAHHEAMGRVCRNVVSLVSVACVAGGLEGAVNAIDGLTDNLQLIDWI